MRRKLLTLALALLMILSILPMAAMADVCSGSHEIAPKEGTYRIDGTDIQLTFEQSGSGWTVSNGNTVYDGPAGNVWQYKDGCFIQKTTRNVSRGFILWNILFGRVKITTTYYLSANGDYDTEKDSFKIIESFDNPEHTYAYKAVDGTHHKVYCSLCKAEAGIEECTFEDGHCIYCNNQDRSVTGYIDVSVKQHSVGFLLWKLYTADIKVSSDVVGIKKVMYSFDENGIEFQTGIKALSTRPINLLVIIVETTDGVHAYKYTADTGTVTNYDLIK